MVSRPLLFKFLLQRHSEGATHAVIKIELQLWREVLLEVGTGLLPESWLQLKVNWMFPVRRQIKSAKEPVSHTLLLTILQGLSTQWSSKDRIQRTLALRDSLMAIFGFYHLLRQSEIV